MYIKNNSRIKYDEKKVMEVREKILYFAKQLANQYNINFKEIVEYIETTDINHTIDVIVDAWNYIVKENNYLAFAVLNYNNCVKTEDKKRILSDFGRYWKYYLYKIKHDTSSLNYFMKLENFNDLLVGIATFEATTPLLQPLKCA